MAAPLLASAVSALCLLADGAAVPGGASLLHSTEGGAAKTLRRGLAHQDVESGAGRLVVSVDHGGVARHERLNASEADPLSLIAWGESLVRKDAPRAWGETHPKLKCGVSQRVNANTDKWEKCPPECPLMAEHWGNGIHCDFRCVEATTAACSSMNPKTSVVDLERKICRACMVDGCAECNTDGTDTCKKCSTGYDLVKGRCHSQYFWACVAVGLAVAAVLGVVVAWFVDLARRPVVNQAALDHGLRQRSRGKLHMPKRAGESIRLWPLSTNLTNVEVAGPGMTLAFNFQVAIMVWAAVLAIAWIVLASTHDGNFFNLGLRRAQTARQNCIVVAFGYETQNRLMFAKTCFCIGAYVFSFAYFTAISIRHARLFQTMDEKMLTYKDFTARVLQLPEMKGTDHAETELKKAVAEATGKNIIGVSICWNYQAEEEEVEDQLLSDHRELLGELDSSDDDLAEGEEGEEEAAEQDKENDKEKDKEKEGQEGEPKAREQCWAFQMVEDKVFGSATKDVLARAAGESTEEPGREIKEVLENMCTTGQAFVIFETEQARNEAVAAIAEKGGFEFRGEMATMESADHEPASMQWKNVVPRSWMWFIKRVLGGFGTIFLALATWVLAFYAPYAYFLMSFNYAYGNEPGIMSNLAFTMIVVIGNAIMYFICGEVADRIGFQYNDDREVCYMLLYSFACICNVVLDMVVTFYMAYWMMVGVGMATYHGVALEQLTSFQQIFESYAMQRSLGQNLFAYAFPSTFLIPFLIEPFATIYLPYLLGSFIVRAHKNITRHDAEGLLAPLLMDLSRYADVLLNVMLAALVFFFPGGFTHRMFLGLALSHVVIYIVDHYKVLRCIPSCYYASNSVDWWALWMLSIPCAFIIGATVFKANCQEEGDFGMCVEGWPLLGIVLGVVALHMLLHTAVLLHVVPLFLRKDLPESDTPYQEVAQAFACSWFSCNPIHCLRSKHIYEHNPPCAYYYAGKEHCLRPNPDIGLYFEGELAEVEDYKTTTLQHLKSLSKSYSYGLFSPSSKKKDEEGEDKEKQQP